ncbi:MAG: hypothetical protein M9928_11465 [Anaerolineae bacterium]|nr:hypothetical protein [Anaerolineae bacterium]MCO5193041.1 hypothetical protein [Anaerolineae bacterium]MCO5205643.1 hypothetical protein [Anaerolineae bacterium]
MDGQPLFSPAPSPAGATVPGSVYPHGFLDRPLLTPRYLPGTTYYGHCDETIRWSLAVYARIVTLIRRLFPDELPLYPQFNPLDSNDMEAAIGKLHRLVNDRLFPVYDLAAEAGYFYEDDDGDGHLPDNLIWLTPAVLGVTYDSDYAAPYGNHAESGAFGTRGVVDFMMALAAEEIGAVNPYDADRIPNTPFGIARYHYGTAPSASFSLQNALHGIGCITLPQPYDALPLLLRIVLKQTGNPFLDMGADEQWEATIEWDDGEAIGRLTQAYRQVQPWLETMRQFDLFYKREQTSTRRTILGYLVSAWQIGSGQLALFPTLV